MQSWTITPLAVADIDAVARAADAIWRAHYPGIIGTAQIDYMLEAGYAPDVIRAELAGGVRWDVAAGREILGFAAYGADGDAVKLHKLYVRAEVRGRGIARALLARAEGAARDRGAAGVVLAVNKTNLGAVRAYQRLGYAIAAASVTDIGGGFVMDDYVMRRPIKDTPKRYELNELLGGITSDNVGPEIPTGGDVGREAID